MLTTKYKHYIIGLIESMETLNFEDPINLW
jgi:hypothetical protein